LREERHPHDVPCMVPAAADQVENPAPYEVGMLDKVSRWHRKEGKGLFEISGPLQPQEPRGPQNLTRSKDARSSVRGRSDVITEMAAPRNRILQLYLLADSATPLLPVK